MRRSLIINGCILGNRISGVERFVIEITKRLPIYYKIFEDGVRNMIIYSNYNFNFKKDFKNILEIKNCPKFLSSDSKYGNLSRFLWSNTLPLKHTNSIIVNFSQVDGIFNPIKRNNKIISVIHDVIPLQFKLGKSFYYYKYVLPLVIKNSDLIITVSNHSKKLIQNYFPSNQAIEVVYPGIGNSFKFKNMERQPAILYVGRLTHMKNLDRLLLAFSRLKRDKKFKEYELWIVGSGSTDWMFQYVDDKIKNFVRIFKDVSDEKLVNLYNKAYLFVFPSLYEGFGFPPLEAMACGCPVIVSNMGSLPEVCGEAAYYINPYSIESIYSGMYEVLTNDNLRNQLIKRGLSHVKRYTWDASVKKFASLIKALV